ncbi:MAG: TIGR02466 family protein [Proteobacteria bacterium]|nr:TIGR02466 family protein [Pseudomonadota bacterium]MDA1059078.1 TIGR02466 family protein [Pseudomonadota bacterium]
MLSEEQMPERVEVRNAFPTPIAMAMLPDAEKLNKQLKKLILAREKKETPRDTYDSNIGGWHSERNFPEWGGSAGDQVIETGRLLADRMTASRTGRPAEVAWQANAWANINRQGHSNEFHVHPGCYWSGVYYVDDGGCADDKSLGGEFVIMDPRGPGPSMYAPSLCFHGPGGNSVGATELLSPRTGIMLMFPSWLSHGVRPYHGGGERISIAFNFAVAP